MPWQLRQRCTYGVGAALTWYGANGYGYTLQKNGIGSNATNGNWYLRSQLTQEPVVPVPATPVTPAPVTPDPGTPDPGAPPPDPVVAAAPSPPPIQPLYQPGVPVYENYPQMLLRLGDLPTLRQRVGRRGSQAKADASWAGWSDDALWVRVEDAHSRFEPSNSPSSSKQDNNAWKAQAGLDKRLSTSESGTWVGGLTAQMGQIRADVESPHGDGKIETQGYGIGATLTWYGANGNYLDAQGQMNWYDTDLQSKLIGAPLAKGNDGTGYNVGVEVGRVIPLSAQWTLIPQAQLTYGKASFDTFVDPFKAQVSLDKAKSLMGRLGVALDYQVSQDEFRQGKVYGIANIYNEFLNGTRVDVAGTDFTHTNDRLWGGVGMGGSYKWAKGKYMLYGELLLKSSLEHFADSYTVSGTAGFRMGW